MTTRLLTDVGRALWRPVSLVWLALSLTPIAYELALNAGAAHSMYAFSNAMQSPLVIALPVVAVAVYVLPFSRELAQNYIQLTRTRTPLISYLRRKAAANAIATFVVFFLYGAVPFTWFQYIRPALGLAHYVSAADFGTIVPADAIGRLSGIYALSPALYGLTYSSVLGLMGALFATIGFLMLFVIRSRVLAVAIPFLLFIAESAIFFSQGADLFTFDLAFIQFGVRPAAAWTIAVPIALAAAIVTALYMVIASKNRTGRLLE